MPLFTIGYSGQDIQSFGLLLTRHQVSVLCDVRSTPFSAFKPDFSRGPLKTFLNKCGIKYAFFGDELGARPKDRSCYVGGQAKYERIAKTSLFQSGLERVKNGSSQLNLALMCSEKDPIECHRAILVCRHLAEIRHEIRHIHGNSRLESQDDLETRLVALHNLTPPPLLSVPGDWDRALEKAYLRQAESIAFQEQ